MKDYINNTIKFWVDERLYSTKPSDGWTIEITTDRGVSINDISCDDLTKISELVWKITQFKSYTVLLRDEEGEMNWKHDNNFPCGDRRRDDLNEKSLEELYGDDEALEILCDLIEIGDGIERITKIEIYPSLAKLRIL